MWSLAGRWLGGRTVLRAITRTNRKLTGRRRKLKTIRLKSGKTYTDCEISVGLVFTHLNQHDGSPSPGLFSLALVRRLDCFYSFYHICYKL